MAGNDEEPLPISVLTGFLGSGKTTLLRALLSRPQFAGTAVLVNELGEIGIDHLLVQHVTEELVLLESGCLCCTLRGDLVEQLGLLWQRRQRGEIPAFTRVVIETTGLADPAPILATLLAHPALCEHFYVDGIVCTVDAEHGLTSLARYVECRKQISVADRVVITKTDRVDAAQQAALRREIELISPGVTIRSAVLGAIEPQEIMNVGHLDTRSLVPQSGSHAPSATHAPGHPDPHTHVQSIAVSLQRPLKFPAFSWWVALTTQLHGEHILRLKAIVSAVDEPTPIAVQAVQHVVYPPLTLPAMPELAGKSYIVVLTTGLDALQREQLRTSLLAFDA